MRSVRLALLAASAVAFACVVVACDDDLADPTGGGFDASPSGFDASSPEAFAPAADASTREPDAGGDASDGAPDANDGAPTCTTTTLLQGGTDVTTQGWSIVKQDPATVSNGADHVKLVTTTTQNATSGGQLLLSYPNAFDPTKPFALAIEVLVEAVSPHNPLDSAAAVLVGFTPGFGTAAERGRMVYLDPNAIGWADDTQSFAVAVTNGAYHTVLVESGGNGTPLTVKIDGVLALTKPNVTSNGTLAVGDQTNDPNVDATIRVRSVKRLCP